MMTTREQDQSQTRPTTIFSIDNGHAIAFLVIIIIIIRISSRWSSDHDAALLTKKCSFFQALFCYPTNTTMQRAFHILRIHSFTRHTILVSIQSIHFSFDLIWKDVFAVLLFFRLQENPASSLLTCLWKLENKLVVNWKNAWMCCYALPSNAFFFIGWINVPIQAIFFDDCVMRWW